MVADDPAMWRAARIAGSPLGRWMYRHLNLSLRVLAPGAYGDRGRLTSEMCHTDLERFVDPWAREVSCCGDSHRA